jgi:lipopolysaccharide transport system ATP-binding protein
MNPVTLSHVWKQYQIGLRHHSLRDAIPSLLRRLRGGNGAAIGDDGILWALRDVSFSVSQGQTLGIIGRNGAGKSTVLKLLSGISKQTKGTLAVKGKLAALIEVGAGFHPDLTGRENVFLNGAILGLKRQEIRRLFDQIVAFSELERFIDTPVKRYSSGMYVRLGFAIAAHVDPDVLLIDEVLAVGDLAFQQKCLQRIHDLKQMGKTMIFISHNLSSVQRICDRAILLNSGQVVAEGPTSDVIRTYRQQVVEAEQQRFAAARRRAGESVRRGPLQIEAVRLRNQAGEVADTFEPGDQMTLEIAYACTRSISSPSVTVRIERLDGLLCHVASSGRDEAALPMPHGQGTLSLTYQAINLLPNGYRVEVEIREGDSPVPLDQRESAGFFTIASDHNTQGGTVHLDHSWDARSGGSARRR